MSRKTTSAIFGDSPFESIIALREMFQSSAAHVIEGVNAPSYLKKNTVFWVVQLGNKAGLHWCSIDIHTAIGQQAVVRFYNNHVPAAPSQRFWPFRVVRCSAPVELNLALSDFDSSYWETLKMIAAIMSGSSSALDWALLQHGESGNYWSEAAELLRLHQVGKHRL